MDAILKFIKPLIGSSVVSFTARLLIALICLYTGSATSLGDALGQALDKDRSIAAAVELINETPSPELVEAVKEESAKVE